MTPAPVIKLCAIAAYRLFHSHAQVFKNFYWLDEVNRSIDCSFPYYFDKLSFIIHISYEFDVHTKW